MERHYIYVQATTQQNAGYTFLCHRIFAPRMSVLVVCVAAVGHGVKSIIAQIVTDQELIDNSEIGNLFISSNAKISNCNSFSIRFQFCKKLSQIRTN